MFVVVSAGSNRVDAARVMGGWGDCRQEAGLLAEMELVRYMARRMASSRLLR